MKNILGREIPDFIEGYGNVKHFEGANNKPKSFKTVGVNIKTNENNKVLNSIDELLNKIDIKDGITISFHHHLRNGDYVLNEVMDCISKKGIKNITIAASSIFPIHAPLVKHIENQTVTGIITSYVSGPVAKAISEGKLKKPAILTTHGGRPRSIESGDLHIDIAFIAAPCCDCSGNLNGALGKSAFGTLGYAVIDAEYADLVVAVTDNIVPYPANPIVINQTLVDYVVKINSIGDQNGIVAGTTKITKDPIALRIAKMATKVIENSGYFKNGMSFQTGAGGTSLAVAVELKKLMQKNNIKGSFASGGITSYIVEMLELDLFENLFDTQCFDLVAINSYKNNPKHQFMSCSMYSNPNRKGNVADNLDIMILGATEIDLNFNVNVATGSDGIIIGGSGGHSDTAHGAKISIVVTNLIKSRLPIVKEKVTTVVTPGESIDVLVTEYGIAINPKREDLIENLKHLPIFKIEQLKEIAEKITGTPKKLSFSDEIVAVIEYRDGSLIDVIKKVL